jgi:hypothetical protein
MAVKTGGGAAVASGAGYQARVGAYLLACGLCETPGAFVHGREIVSIAFETAEAVDDLRIRLATGLIRLQVKASIDFTTAPSGELRSVFDQFERQSRSAAPEDRYGLVTSRRASKRITHELRAALEAFQTVEEERFRQDQPRAIVSLIDELLGLLAELRNEAGLPADAAAGRSILRRTFVWVLDLEAGDPLEQAMALVLQSKDFVAPAALWGRLVLDCLDHARGRRTVDLAQARSTYERYRTADETPSEAVSDTLLKVEFAGMGFAAGRELALVEVPIGMARARGVDTKLAVLEFYRFDDAGQERIRFEDASCILSSGARMPLIRRSATWEGMTRMLPRDGVTSETPITLVPINSAEDHDAGPHAQAHQEKLRVAAMANPHPLRCLHCDRPVSSVDDSLIELNDEGGLAVGLSHQSCLLPEDRILGSARSELFTTYAELVHFDYDAWFKAAHSGQAAFGGLTLLGETSAIMAWAGKPLNIALGRYVVAVKVGDDWELVTERGRVQRFTRQGAEDLTARTNAQIEELSRDPYCYSSETKTFGPRSFLLSKFSGRERVTPVERAEVRPYDARKAARFERPSQWYAPLMLLVSEDDGMLIDAFGAVALLTDPLSLATYLENWKSVGIEVGAYETVSLLTDADFDDFMAAMVNAGAPVVVNPMFDPATGDLLAGLQIRWIGDLTAPPEDALADA